MKASPIPKSRLLRIGSRFIASLRVGGLLAFGLLLWGMNVLPLQRPLLVCECSVLVSAFQEARIRDLSQQSEIASPTVDWLSYQGGIRSLRTDEGSEEGVSVRRMQLRVGLDRKVAIGDLEEELDRLTSATTVASRPTPVENSVLPGLRWRLRVAEHAMARFELDRERQRGAQGAEDAGTFRLVSRPSTVQGSDAGVPLLESLRAEVEAAKGMLAAAELEAASRERDSRGVFTMVGYPKFVLRGDRLSSFHALMLLFLACFVVSAVASRWGHRSKKVLARMRFRASQVSNGLHQEWMRLLKRQGIPYLGVLTIGSTRGDEAESAPHSDYGAIESVATLGMRLSTLARWSDRILFLWVACFVWRYLFDSLWRELLFRAPLAAFSSMLFGI